VLAAGVLERPAGTETAAAGLRGRVRAAGGGGAEDARTSLSQARVSCPGAGTEGLWEPGRRGSGSRDGGALGAGTERLWEPGQRGSGSRDGGALGAVAVSGAQAVVVMAQTGAAAGEMLFGGAECWEQPRGALSSRERAELWMREVLADVI